MNEEKCHRPENGTAPLVRLSIAGTALPAYTVVCAAPALLPAVTAAVGRLAARTGVTLPVCGPTDPETAHEILIGDTGRTASDALPAPEPLCFSARVDGGKLVLRAGGLHSLRELLTRLTDLLPAAGSAELGADFALSGDLRDDPFDFRAPADAQMRVMSVNILAEYETWGGKIPVEERKEIFFSMLETYRPDVLGLQEFSPAWHDALADYAHADEWELVTFPNPNASAIPPCVFSLILYRKARFDRVDAGMRYYSRFNNNKCRCCSWVVLRDRETGREFCMISTHWDGKDTPDTMTQVAEMCEVVNEMRRRGLPVFTTGDFNSNEVTAAYPKLLADCEMQDVKFTAERLLNRIGSWHDLGCPTPSYYSCDHITATKDVTVRQFETLIHNRQIWGSDHSWLVADVSLC